MRLYFNQIVNQYERQQSAIIDVITNSHRNYISHDLFTASQIENQVELISRQIGTEYRVESIFTQLVKFLCSNWISSLCLKYLFHY